MLVDRSRRELPLRPDYIGKNLPTARDERVFVRLTEVDGEDSVNIHKLAIRKTTSHLRKEEPNVYPNLSRKDQGKGCNPDRSRLDVDWSTSAAYFRDAMMMLHGETLRAAAESVVAFSAAH